MVLHRAVSLADYARTRIASGDAIAPVKAWMGRILTKAGLTARMPVLDEGGRPHHGVETVLFTDGPARYAAIFRNPGYERRFGNQHWRRQLKAFPDPIEITTRFDGTAHVYDIRSGKYLGKMKNVRATLPPWEPICYALLPYRVTGIDGVTPKTAARGEIVPVRLTVIVEGGAGPGHHVLRVNVLGPDGALRTFYSRNADAEAGIAKMAIPLALNDPVGTWRLRIRDVASGVTAEHKFDVK